MGSKLRTKWFLDGRPISREDYIKWTNSREYRMAKEMTPWMTEAVCAYPPCGKTIRGYKSAPRKYCCNAHFKADRQKAPYKPVRCEREHCHNFVLGEPNGKGKRRRFCCPQHANQQQQINKFVL